jgi:hypothetical protein
MITVILIITSARDECHFVYLNEDSQGCSWKCPIALIIKQWAYKY